MRQPSGDAQLRGRATRRPCCQQFLASPVMRLPSRAMRLPSDGYFLGRNDVAVTWNDTLVHPSVLLPLDTKITQPTSRTRR
jgi:hypothetical protein